jgi:hypothetical protein
VHLFLLCVSDTWALVLGLYGRYFYIVEVWTVVEDEVRSRRGVFSFCGCART